MTYLLHDLVSAAARQSPDATAVIAGSNSMTYRELDGAVIEFAAGLRHLGLTRKDRVAVYLPKCNEAVISIFGISAAGGVFVPVNPVLKSIQVQHILNDCGAKILVTNADRLTALEAVLPECASLRDVVLTKGDPDAFTSASCRVHRWNNLAANPDGMDCPTIDVDMAGILYTSGSTGKPKGVVLSHRNFVVGAKCVSQYIGNTDTDRILAVLPLSFDAGFSQVTTAFNVGASVILHDFIFPADIIKVSAQRKITGITAVPPLWAQIADQDWPEDAADNVRYFANTGGKMPRRLLDRLREIFPNAEPFLMYGLTEAFRSTYLPPSEVDRRPDSIGKAIPNAEIMVVRDDGTECGPDEPGELVHRGALVAQGYWNAPDKTRGRFRPNPCGDPGVPQTEMVVFSGDTVRRDSDGFLYFVGRKDDMIKTSGYRVSPTEIDEAGFDSGLIKEIATIGVADDRLGQRIVVVVAPIDGGAEDTESLLSHYRKVMPTFMVPSEVQWRSSLPRSANGKIDRQAIAEDLRKQDRLKVKS